MTFEQFKQRVGSVVAKYANGFTSDDLADACWYDHYEDLGEDAEDEDICECLAEYDDIFQQMWELNR